MHFTYFKAQLGKPSPEVVEKYYGPFDPSDVDPKNLEKARAAHEEKRATGPLHDPKIGPLVAIGYLNPDGGTDVASAEAGDFAGERALIEEFWARYNKTGGGMAGWGIHAGDLHKIKVRSWAHRIQIPARAMRGAGAGRTAWIGFTDVRTEFDGRPSGAESTEFSTAARMFKMEGERASPEEFFKLWSSGDPSDRRAAVERLQDDLAQTAGIAVSIGIDHSLPPLGLDIPIVEPVPVDIPDKADRVRTASSKATHWDIETGPAELAELKRILGEFDLSSVKTGNLKDPEKIAAKIEAARIGYDEALLKASMLDPKLGRIVAIGYKLPDGTVEIPDLPEKDLIADFWRRYETSGGSLTGWNIFNFDLEWMKVRSWFHGIQVPPRAMSLAGNGYARWSGFTDLMREFLGSRNGYMSLNDAARFFGLEAKTGHGADFYKLWESKDPEKRAKAVTYLTGDVDLSQGVGARMGCDGIDLEQLTAGAEVYGSSDGARKPADDDFDVI